MNLGWPDFMIAAILAIAAFKGYKRGFISELSGAIALTAALITPWYYNGTMDTWLQVQFKLGQGSAHVCGMFLTGLATYAIVIGIAMVLNTIAKLPFLGLGNALAGAAVGFVKGAVLLWLLLYVALFFPLSKDIRADLHASPLVAYFVAPDKHIDDTVLGMVPWFARPFLRPYFKRHDV